ncbi:MAG TPA: hypothetical protein VMU25_04365 [Candidatus Paceibacterota bacterium]|nr:hypothetical protein [Candidatus Paceibacterota bacterium]
MVTDYFQDIVPPDNSSRSSAPIKLPITPAPVAQETTHETEAPDAPEKSIRNIDAPQRRLPAPANTGTPINLPPKPRRTGSTGPSSRWWLWIIALILILAVVALALFMLRKTTVTVTPRSHTIVFDQTAQFTAYPAATAATGTLTYTLTTTDMQDSEVVPATGTQHVETKASGSITVYNDYSTSPVKLIKNTRFATPNGLIFRTPDDIVVPGKVGTTPGHVTVTVVADQAGQQYDIGPTPRFTVPGLQNVPAMYSNIYAQSNASTTGGFVGDQPAADPSAAQKAIADIRGRIEQKIRESLKVQSGSTIVLPDLIQITYQDQPPAKDQSGGVVLAEQAHVVIPQFDEQSFAQTLAQSIGTDTTGATLSFVPGKDFVAAANNIASTTLGTDPIQFSLAGTGTLVWQVDAGALAQALAGKDQSAFSTIESGFSGVQEAHARIEPFWKTTFPTNPTDIKVVIQAPATPQ